MKITKKQLKQIIKEELEVVLTNEEAEEMFGEGIRAQLEEQQLNEDIDTLMQNLTPENLDLLWRAMVKMGTSFAVPMLAALLARLGYEAGATALAKDALARKEKNWLVNFIYNEATGYQDMDGGQDMVGDPPVNEGGKPINEEEADCYKDYKAGGLTREEYEECIRSYQRRSGDYPRRDSGYRSKYKGYRRPRYQYDESNKENDDKFLQDIESTGEWTDYTIAQLKKKKAALMKKKKRTADEVKTVRQLNFAINAKQGDYK